MSQTFRVIISFSIMASLLIAVGIGQSWSLSLAILNLCLISAIMALGVNIQWGYAGLFNVGIMGFAALGGVAAALVSKAPVTEAWAAGGANLALAVLVLAITITIVVLIYRRLTRSIWRLPLMLVTSVVGYMILRSVFDPAVLAIEAVNPGKTGYLGGLGLPIIFFLGDWRRVCGRRGLADRKVGPGLACRLSGDRHAGHFGNHHRNHEERRLADARGQERHRASTSGSV